MSNQKFVIQGEDKRMVVYENQLVLEAKQKIGGKDWQKIIKFNSISSIDFQECTFWIKGRIAFNIRGENNIPNLGAFGNAVVDLGWNENSMYYHKKNLNSEILAAKKFIEDEIFKASSLKEEAVFPISSADELRKFKQLLDDGVISQSEFDLQKKKLL